MDLNDATQAGINIDDLIRAAKDSDPILGTKWSELADAGMKFLVELAAAWEIAQNQPEAFKLVSAFIADKSKRFAAGATVATRSTDAQAVITGMLGAPRDWRPALRDLRTALDEEAIVIRRALEVREEKYKAKVLDATLRELGVTGLKCPNGWQVDPEGIQGDEGFIAPSPLVIIGRGRDFDDGSVMLELAWRDGNQWTKQLVDRGKAMDSRQLVRLAKDGAPVSSANAGPMVKYLVDFEAQNVGKFPSGTVTRRLGWHGPAFVLGEASYGGDVKLIDERGYGAPFHESGTWDEWCDIVKEHVAPHPLAMLGIYAATAAVLLGPLGESGFAVDWSGETSQGKTTALQIAASVCGRPGSQSNPNGVMRSWRSSSSVGPMWLAWFHQSVPVILDDTKRGKPYVVAEALYDIPSGQDQLRGETDGQARRLRTWKTVLLSSGEAPITSFTRAGGAQARALVLSGSPLGADGDLTARALDAGLNEHYGHLMPRVVKWLVDNRAAWPKMRERFKKTREEIKGQLDSTIAGRVAGMVAAIRTAASLCHHLGVPGDPEPAIAELIRQAQVGVSQADMPREALDLLYAWIQGNEGKFLGRNVTDTGRQLGDEPSDGWLGRWETGTDWGKIGIQKPVVQRKLEQWGYAPNDVISAWYRREWLEVDAEGKDPKYGKGGARILVVKRPALCYTRT